MHFGDNGSTVGCLTAVGLALLIWTLLIIAILYLIGTPEIQRVLSGA